MLGSSFEREARRRVAGPVGPSWNQFVREGREDELQERRAGMRSSSRGCDGPSSRVRISSARRSFGSLVLVAPRCGSTRLRPVVVQPGGRGARGRRGRRAGAAIAECPFQRARDVTFWAEAGSRTWREGRRPKRAEQRNFRATASPAVRPRGAVGRRRPSTATVDHGEETLSSNRRRRGRGSGRTVPAGRVAAGTTSSSNAYGDHPFRRPTS